MAAATAIALGATSVISAGASFAQAAKQQRQMREAEESAAKYMEDARKKFSVNFAEQLQVPLEGYEMASDLNRQALAQNTEALKESGQRAILGGVAGLQRQAQEGSEQLRMNMQQDLYERDKAIAAEESRLRDIQGEIDLGEASGAQQAAADAQMMKAQSIQSGLGSLASGATSLYEGSDLYKQSKETKLAEKFGKGLTVDQKSALSDKFSKLSRGQRNYLEQADPDMYSPFLKTPESLSKANLASLGGIKKGALGQIPFPKITGR